MVIIGASDARERLIADSQFGGGATPWAPGTWYVGLSTTAPADDGSGFTEPSGGSYGRAAVPNTAAAWPAAETVAGITSKRNGAKITFPNPTGNWGALTHYGIFTTPSGGTPEYTNPLDTSISPRAGNTPVEFDVDQLLLVWS